MLDLIAQGAVALLACGLIERIAGIAAAAGQQWQEAETHFSQALRQAEELPYLPERADVRYWHARMLLDRNASGDRDRAGQLLNEARSLSEDIGMHGLVRRIDEFSAGSTL